MVFCLWQTHKNKYQNYQPWFLTVWHVRFCGKLSTHGRHSCDPVCLGCCTSVVLPLAVPSLCRRGQGDRFWFSKYDHFVFYRFLTPLLWLWRVRCKRVVINVYFWSWIWFMTNNKKSFMSELLMYLWTYVRTNVCRCGIVLFVGKVILMKSLKFLQYRRHRLNFTIKIKIFIFIKQQASKIKTKRQ